MGEFLVLVIVGMMIGLYLIRVFEKTQQDQIDKMVDGALDLYKKFTIPLQCEKGDNNIIYCYDNNTNDFVCQGADIEEIKANFKARYPDHGSYIMHESLHLFPETQTEEDPTDQELRQRVKEIHTRDNT
tara:strand:+ start:60 stop:446 length:387 start_codon:yes stop_codon:yes gene_type:complete